MSPKATWPAIGRNRVNIAGLLRRKQPKSMPVAEARLRFRAECRTHVGRVRSVNEDRLLDRSDRALWAVVDGMGGHDAGAAAAEAAVEALQALADRQQPITAAGIRASLIAANRTIHQAGQQAGSPRGATVVVAWADAERVSIFWAGDSRAYRLRDGAAEPLTRDHSVVQEMVDAGLLAEEAAGRHPKAHIITRALGVAPAIAIDVVEADLRRGDQILLCSDGVSRSLDPRDFRTLPDADGLAADRFLANALQRDGSDNATLIAITAAW